jgi:hypothetical protein
VYCTPAPKPQPSLSLSSRKAEEPSFPPQAVDPIDPSPRALVARSPLSQPIDGFSPSPYLETMVLDMEIDDPDEVVP